MLEPLRAKRIEYCAFHLHGDLPIVIANNGVMMDNPKPVPRSAKLSITYIANKDE